MMFLAQRIRRRSFSSRRLLLQWFSFARVLLPPAHPTPFQQGDFKNKLKGQAWCQAVGSSAFAAGQVKRQVTPEGAYSRSTVPFTLRSAISCITTVPNPRRCGGDTGGPPRSVQLIVKVSPSVPQPICRRPASVESAPYLLALVASSWSARPIACAEAGFRCSLGPRATTREPVRSTNGE